MIFDRSTSGSQIDLPDPGFGRLEREIDEFKAQFRHPPNFFDNVVTRMIHRADEHIPPKHPVCDCRAVARRTRLGNRASGYGPFSCVARFEPDFSFATASTDGPAIPARFSDRASYKHGASRATAA